jgi:hypothetical protein
LWDLLALQEPYGVRLADPTALFGNANGDYFIFVFIEGLKDGSRRQQRDFVLTAAPTEEDANPEFLHQD